MKLTTLTLNYQGQQLCPHCVATYVSLTLYHTRTTAGGSEDIAPSN